LHPVTLLSTLLHSETDAIALNARLKMSCYERDLVTFVVTHRNSQSSHPTDPIRNFRFLIVDTKGKPSDCKDWAGQTLRYIPIREIKLLGSGLGIEWYNRDFRYRGEDELAAEIEAWSVPKFPVGGADLLEAGCPKGKLMSVVMGKLREKWKAADFLASRDNLLADMSTLLDEIDPMQLDTDDQRLKGKKRKKST
jgi:hypothetical protein